MEIPFNSGNLSVQILDKKPFPESLLFYHFKVYIDFKRSVQTIEFLEL